MVSNTTAMALVVCGFGGEDRQRGRQDGEAASQRRVHRSSGSVAEQGPAGEGNHIVLDNLSAHKTKAVEEFLAQYPKLRFHFTPTYSSWLNQVELWFAKSSAM